MTLVSLLIAAAVPAVAAPVALRGAGGVEAVFEAREGRIRWSSYRDPAAGREWPVAGPLLSLQTEDGFRANLGDVGFTVPADAPPTAEAVTLEATLARPAAQVRQVFSFCPDGRTLRIRTRLRATGPPLTIQRVGLLEVRLPGQKLQRIGPEYVSCPIVGDRIYAGVEHPSVICQVDGDMMVLAQHSYTKLGPEWVEVPAAVLGAPSDADGVGPEGVRRAFLRYLDTIRVKPRDMHLHYNNWWTMPVPSTEKDVLDNIAALKAGLYDPTGLFFDSYAMDMGWSDPHTVWEINRKGYPHGFRRIRDALAKMHSRPGLWVSPSSCYPPALDNSWLEKEDYEVSPGAGFACLALGGRYQHAFKQAVLRHARNANLGHVKFDGLVWPCPATTHGHHPGFESFQPIAEGLMDVLDALRKQNPDIALEPTCLGYYPSPWWLMHTPFVIGPFGDDCPRGQSPCPEWLESLTTGRDIANLQGRDAFWMPSSALECFDIVMQCPGDIRNHAVMAVARGHWFQSTYINPRYMDRGQWRFFADVMRWARARREELQNPVVFGGDPARRQAYGYAYLGGERQVYFARNPWMERAQVSLPDPPGRHPRELRRLYPCREMVCRVAEGAAWPKLTLGPYETAVFEATPTAARPRAARSEPAPPVEWAAEAGPSFERLQYPPSPAAYGPSWTSPEGDAPETLACSGAGRLQAGAGAELCLLVETAAGVPPATCSVQLDNMPLALRESGSRGAFAATGAATAADWQWFLAPLPRGRHHLAYRVTLPLQGGRCGVFVRGRWEAPDEMEPPAAGLVFPLPAAPGRPWSQTVVPLAGPEERGVTTRRAERTFSRIDGVYLDSLEWVEATAGWGQVHRNASIMGTPMLMGGRIFHRGIGAHAVSRIVYDLPPGYARFAATIGCDQEVWANTVVFVVQGDGREIFRSPLMRRDDPPVEISLPLGGLKRLTLIVEDGGDGILADHADWAEARLLRAPGPGGAPQK